VIANEVLERFSQQTPLTVMAQLGMQRALDAQWIDELFEQESQSQYTRELLFSTTVELMSLVALGLRPSVHAAAKSMQEKLPVTVQALYGKLNHTEPEVVRKLVSGSAERLEPVMRELIKKQAPTVKGYRLRIVDGNHLPASEKRLKPLREYRGAALPGQSLVVYDPDLQLAVDTLPCEDAHTQERVLMKTIMNTAQVGDLWMADRNFCTGPILCGLMERGAHFLIREHAVNPHPRALSRTRRMGRIETGTVYEQSVCFEDEQGVSHTLRRVELRLNEPTEDGEQMIRLLSNVSASRMKAKKLAQLYRRRWRIENLFQRLESVLHSEVRTLGHPRAALLAFGVALLAYNVLALLQTALRTRHARTLEEAQMELSSYYIATEIKANHAGMLIAVTARAWRRYESLSAKELAKLLLVLATKVNPRQFRSYPRGPKAVKKKGYVSKQVAQRHVATARVLASGQIPK
jgi:IS4 transposase